MVKMLKVVHLITGLRAGGAETVLYRLLAEMDRARFRSTVVSLTDEGELGTGIRALGVPVHTLGMRRGAGSVLSAVHRLRRLLRRERPDILQTWLYHADLLGTVAARAAGVPVLAWNLRCSQPRVGMAAERPGALLRVLRRLSHVPDAVVVNAEAGRAFHAAVGFGPREWRLIPNGVDARMFRPSPELRARARREMGVDAAAPVVGMVGRYDPLKDVGTFLRAARILLDTRRDAVFVLAGRDLSAENGELGAQIRALGLEGAVRLLGRRTDVQAVYPAFDVAALTSRAEGFPNVVAEAMACGVPCAVTDVGDAALLVGDTGRVVPPGDPGAMAAAWEGLLSLTAAERQRLGAAARDRIAAEFSQRAAVQRYEALYAGLAARSRRAAAGAGQAGRGS
ncbi:MAG TPA: glycosyltransferase, partial [Longimicrobium sp.]|nr:glycosyltransferase [Longimicrobium sp.]